METTFGVFLTFFGYLVGSIPFALLIGKWKTGEDIRNNAFGNMGANNVFETVGKKFGYLTFILDFFKGYIPTALAWLLFSNAHIEGAWVVTTAGSTICGHNWPIFANFRGGKGASTAAGVSIASFPHVGLILFPLLILFSFFTHNISFSAGICFILLPMLILSNPHDVYRGYLSILIPIIFLPKLFPLLVKLIKESDKNPKKMWFILVHGFQKAKSFSFKTREAISKKVLSFSKPIFSRKKTFINPEEEKNEP
ncbi:MAG: glycerol-3-phosphate acyltransferase [Caldisericia bacterium]|nr:glycerol-3-phosphate acyltransferase [Caldisericia bacterium]